MISYRPLASVSTPGISFRPFAARLEDIEWAPLADTEVLTSAHHFPIAVRISEHGPQAGVLLASRFLARKLDDTQAAWRSRYVPMALRAFPFQLANGGDNPLHALNVAVDAKGGGSRQSIAIVDKDGSASAAVKTAHTTLSRLRPGRVKLGETANQLMLCDVLSPLGPAPSSESATEVRYYTVNVRRLHDLRDVTFGALARKGFAPVELISAMAFSQRHLRDGAIDAAAQVIADQAEQSDAPAAVPWLVPWLDMSGLFPADFAAVFAADAAGASSSDAGGITDEES